MTVSYRKVGNRWHIRFVGKRKGVRKEVIKSYPGGMLEKKIKQIAGHLEIEWHSGEFDPFAEKQKNNAPALGEALIEYCETNLASGNWADTTYKTNLNTLTRMLERDWLTQLGPSTDEDFFQNSLNESAGKPVTKKGSRSRLNAFLKWAYNKGYLPEQYQTDLTMYEKIELRNRDDIKHITWQQLRDVCDAHRWLCRQNDRIFNTHNSKDPDFYPDLWWFMFYSLLRKQEVTKLKVSDLLIGERLRVRGKFRRTEIMHLPPPALRIAEKYTYGKKPDELLFVSHMNRARQHLGRAVELALGPEYAERHGAKGFHQLRHGGIVHYISLGKPIAFISKLARHRSISITDKQYADVIQDKIKEAFADIRHEPATSQRREVVNQNAPGLN